jgi:hypothetical protein
LSWRDQNVDLVLTTKLGDGFRNSASDKSSGLRTSCPSPTCFGDVRFRTEKNNVYDGAHKRNKTPPDSMPSVMNSPNPHCETRHNWNIDD